MLIATATSRETNNTQLCDLVINNTRQRSARRTKTIKTTKQIGSWGITQLCGILFVLCEPIYISGMDRV